jgi:ATP-binding cassette subfamily C protein CydC
VSWRWPAALVSPAAAVVLAVGLLVAGALPALAAALTQRTAEVARAGRRHRRVDRPTARDLPPSAPANTARGDGDCDRLARLERGSPRSARWTAGVLVADWRPGRVHGAGPTWTECCRCPHDRR